MSSRPSTYQRRAQASSSDAGFTLMELLVVILIVGILAAIAIPSLLSQKSKAADAAAKEQGHTAQVAMETCATDNGTSYASCTKEKLLAIEPSLAEESSARLILGTLAVDSYEVVSEAVATKDKFTIKRTSTGLTEYLCEPARNSAKAGCPNGAVGSPGSW